MSVSNVDGAENLVTCLGVGTVLDIEEQRLFESGHRVGGQREPRLFRLFICRQRHVVEVLEIVVTCSDRSRDAIFEVLAQFNVFLTGLDCVVERTRWCFCNYEMGSIIFRVR